MAQTGRGTGFRCYFKVLGVGCVHLISTEYPTPSELPQHLSPNRYSVSRHCVREGNSPRMTVCHEFNGLLSVKGMNFGMCIALTFTKVFCIYRKSEDHSQWIGSSNLACHPILYIQIYSSTVVFMVNNCLDSFSVTIVGMMSCDRHHRVCKSL